MDRGYCSLRWIHRGRADDALCALHGSVGIVGLRYLIATSEGELMRRGLLDRMIIWDRQIISLAANRQSQGLRVRCRRYDALVAWLRSFLKSEIHRVLSRLLEMQKPHQIVSVSLLFTEKE